jgi:hypothetical protein
MSADAADADQKLWIIASMFSDQKKRAESTLASAKRTLESHVRAQRHSKALEVLPMICSQYERLAALAHVLQCIASARARIAELLASKRCPPECVAFVAPLCAAPLAAENPPLEKFVAGFFARAWTQAHVDDLRASPEVPELLLRLAPRTAFSLEELHLFARRLGPELAIDFAWLYAGYPLAGGAGAQHAVTVGGRAVSAPGLGPPRPAAPPRAPSAPPADEPPLPPFAPGEYGPMAEFVGRVVAQWRAAL